MLSLKLSNGIKDPFASSVVQPAHTDLYMGTGSGMLEKVYASSGAQPAQTALYMSIAFSSAARPGRPSWQCDLRRWLEM